MANRTIAPLAFVSQQSSGIRLMNLSHLVLRELFHYHSSNTSRWSSLSLTCSLTVDMLTSLSLTSLRLLTVVDTKTCCMASCRVLSTGTERVKDIERQDRFQEFGPVQVLDFGQGKTGVYQLPRLAELLENRTLFFRSSRQLWQDVLVGRVRAPQPLVAGGAHPHEQWHIGALRVGDTARRSTFRAFDQRQAAW